MVALYFLLWILSFNGYFICLFRRRFEETLALSLTVSVFILYFFSFFSLLKTGFMILMVLGALFWVYVFVLWRKDRRKAKEFRTDFLTPGLCVFVFIVLALSLIYHRKGFENADEFMHWGPMVLSSLKHNGFYLSKDILQVNNDYPPFITLLKVLWCGFNGFRYSEPVLFIGQLSFYFSAFLPLFSVYSKKDWKKVILLLLSLIAVGFWVPTTVTAQEWALVYNSIYVDWILPAMALYVWLIFRKEGITVFSAAVVSLGLSAVLLSKQIGICYYLIVGFLIIVRCIREKDRKKILPVVLMALIPLCFYLSWSMAVKASGMSGVYDVGKISVMDLLRNIRIWGTYEYDISREFVSCIFTRNLSSYPFTLSYVFYSLVILVIILFLEKKDGILLSFTLFCGTFGYALVMAVLYMTLFEEGGRLPSFDRYMLSYLYFEVLILFSVITGRLQERKQHWTAYAAALVLLLASINYSSLPVVTPSFSGTHVRVLVVDNTDVFYPSREDVDGLCFDFTLSGANAEDYGVENYRKEIEECPLVYIVNYDPPFYGYWKQFSKEWDPYPDTVFAVMKNEEGFEFIPLWNHPYGFVIDYYLLDKS